MLPINKIKLSIRSLGISNLIGNCYSHLDSQSIASLKRLTASSCNCKRTVITFFTESNNSRYNSLIFKVEPKHLTEQCLI